MRNMFKNIKKKFSKEAPVASGSAKPKESKENNVRDAADKKTKEKPKRRKEIKPPNFTVSGSLDGGFDMPQFTRDDLLKPQVKLVNAPAADRAALFVKKLRLCSICFDWETDSSAAAVRKENADDIRAKEVKRELLLEILEQINKNRSLFTEPVIVELLKMIEINMFRALPVRQSAEHAGDEDEDEPMYEPAWPHLEVIYEIFVRILISNDIDVKLLKKHVNTVFVLHVLELFDSEDARERDALKTILHRIYAKFMSLRAFVRKAINNLFYNFIYESESHNGVAELLEILGSIINGFALPLKQEHKVFLETVLIPMHKVKPLPVFHQQLSYCVTQFVNKDSTLAVPVVKGLLRFWPVTNSSKEVLYLNELEEVLEMTQAEEFKELMVPVFKMLAKTIGSPHFQVAERALFMWQNEYVASLIAANRDVILPILYPVLHTNSQHHWNSTVNNLSVNVLKLFMDMDQNLVAACSQRYVEDEKLKQRQKKQRQDTWKKLQEQHSANLGNMLANQAAQTQSALAALSVPVSASSSSGSAASGSSAPASGSSLVLPSSAASSNPANSSPRTVSASSYSTSDEFKSESSVNQ